MDLRGGLVEEVSDDAPRREQYATSDEYRAAMVEWALSAPPTPSQDAEGDGLYRYEESMGARCCITCLALPGEPHADGCHALALESAIRAPYEALVKAARHAQSALVLLTSELSGQMGYIEGLQQRPHGQAQRVINSGHEAHAFLTAALARVAESLGGGKDG